jgi:predicted transglutaminase-like cysteine proteinase
MDMRSAVAVSASVVAFAACATIAPTQATVASRTRDVAPGFARLVLDEPAMPPMAHTRFCLQNPRDCRVARRIFRAGPVTLTASRRAELDAVNTRVNREIRPERNVGGVAAERWTLAPATGDCNDYAVTKRHELLARGWPARALLLAEVVVPSGEHHLVLVIRTTSGDLVADNLNAQIRPWTAPRYRWVRAQSPRHPMFWSMVSPSSRDVAAR